MQPEGIGVVIHDVHRDALLKPKFFAGSKATDDDDWRTELHPSGAQVDLT
jgi:hypothetical protein